MTPPDTLNPIAPGRTPGGSSTGSAAAVAVGTVPLATGTQTAGSINRPASYCGVVGYKPTFGLLPRDGIKLLSPKLDTVGFLARHVEDLQLVMEGLGSICLERSYTQQVRVAFARTPFWARIQPEARTAIESAAAIAGISDEAELPAYAELTEAQTTIQFYESARSLAAELRDAPEQLSPQLRDALIQGTNVPESSYAQALRMPELASNAWAALFTNYDAVLTPSADGVPSEGLGFTGDPLFCRAITLLGLPSISLPLATTADGLPAGLQLVGPAGLDAELLATAAALLRR
jgi:amidase